MPEAPGSKKQDRFFRLLIPADLSELSKARRLMEEVGRAAPLPDDRIFDLQVAVSEAAANAIEHAASEVEIAAWLLPDRVIVEVTNDGAFQPGLYKDDEHRRRGLGLPLMVSLADQVHVSRMSESQTRVSLTFFLGPRSQRDREGLSASPDAAVCQLEAETMKLELMTTRAEALDEERALTHEEMRQRVEELEKVMDIVPVAIWVAHDPECLDITGNQTANEFYEALPDENVSAGPAPGEQDTTRRFFQDGRELKPEELPMQEAAAQGADIRNSELQVLRPSGALMTMLGNASPLRDAQGQVRGCVGAFVDITERKRAEEALKDSEERTRRKLGSLLSPEGDVGDLELADIIDPSALQSFLEDFHQLARIPLAIIDLKGKVLVGAGWSDICTKFHRVHPETCRNCVESDTLLTTRVPEGEFRLYKCKNHMWDVATPIIVGGKHLGNVFSGQFFFEDEPIDRELFRLQARRYGFDEETYLGALDSVPRLSRDALDAGMGFFTKLAAMVSNESYGNIGLARAIAERDALLESLRVSEERFRLMFERHNAVMLLIDPATGALVDGNVAAAQFYGYPREELRTLSIHDLNQLPAEKVAAEYRKAATEGRTHFEFPHRGADGGTRWVDVHSAPIEMQGSQLLFSIIHDVTERRQAEEALKESRERLDLLAGIVENASQPVGIGFADGRLGVFNRAYSELLGYSQEEFQSLDWSVDLTPAEWREFEAKKLGELQETGHPVTYEKQYIRENGSRIPVELLVHMARDADGAPLYYYSFITDLTERKQAEAERERLLAQERELAHELASTNDELQSQNEEIAAQAEELEAQTEELAAQIEELRVAHEELAVLYGRELEDARLKDALTQVDQSLISSLEHTEILDRALKDGAHALG
ncbi:MAG TPA: PocR ligand-binding domain-containing protein, partial [Thermoleophilia bacterium]